METGAIQVLRSLRDRLHTLRAEHDQAANRFRSNQALGDLVVGIGSLWVEDTFDFPSSEARKAAAKLRARWQESPEYRALESRYEEIEAGVREALRTSMKHPPSLRRAREAMLLLTKITRLEAIVDDAIERLERPPPSKPIRKQVTRIPSRLSPPVPPNRISLLDIVGAIGSLASIVSLVLYVSTQPFSPLIASTLGSVAFLLGAGVVLSLWRRGKKKALK